MSKTIQIREIDDETYAALARRAAEAGISVPDLLRREAKRIAARPSVREWFSRTQSLPGRKESDPVAALDETRGPWPDDARR